MASRNTASSNLFPRLPRKRQTSKLRDVLTRAEVEFDNSGCGTMKVKSLLAVVVPQADGLITMRVDVDPRDDPTAALELGRLLPGNVRYAVVGPRYRLAAETRTDGVAHLAESMAEIQQGFAAALSKRKPRQPATDDDGTLTVAMQQAIKAGGWTDEQCVEIDDGWELQPRLAGEAVPVRVRIANRGVQASRLVLETVPDDAPVRSAVSHQALLFNDRLRFTRLALTGGRLVVESRLRAGLIDPDWLDFAARAVASAAKAVTPTMRVLAQDESLCKRYAELFLEP